MLYLDTSALIKFYFKEAGSEQAIARARGSAGQWFTSVLSYAEVHAVIARKGREGAVSTAKLTELRTVFENDWTNLLHTIDLNRESLAALPGLLDRFILKSGDVVQLSAAIWLRDRFAETGKSRGPISLEFWVSDRKLARAASSCGLWVFNPEDSL